MYSAGRPFEEVRACFIGAVDAFLAFLEVPRAGESLTPANFDAYVFGLWWPSLTRCLQLDAPRRDRLLAAIRAHLGQDRLVARLLGEPSPGARLHHRKLEPLEAAFDAPDAAAAIDHLQDYLSGWYSRMSDAYWHDNHGIELAYFGYWAVEAAGCVVQLGLDDAPLRDFEHYPAQLAAWGRQS